MKAAPELERPARVWFHRPMILAVVIAAFLAPQYPGDFLVVTYADAYETSAVNVGSAFVPDGEDYLLTTSYTVHHQGTEATRWTTPAYTVEFLAFRCEDQTYRLRRSLTYSPVADPFGPHEPDGPFTSVAADPKRQAQADAICQPKENHTEGFPSRFLFLEAYGLHFGPR